MNIDNQVLIGYNKNMKNSRLQKVIDNFNSLNADEQKKIISYIDKTWRKVYDEYLALCSADEELCKAYDELSKVKSAMSFNWEEHYTRYLYTENEFDPEMADDIYEYDPEQQEKAKYIYEHLAEVNKPHEIKRDELKTQLEQAKLELEELKNNRGLFRRIKIALQEAKIKGLEDAIFRVNYEIKDNIHTANFYGDCLRKHEEKLNYEQNYETLVAPYKKLYEERTKMYAERVVAKFLEIEPVLVCKEQRIRISAGQQRSFSSEPLNEACNAKRYKVMFGMKDKGEEKL